MNQKMTIEAFQEAQSNYIGWCRNCGCERDSTEPDAEEYDCPECGENQVFGADEFLIRGWIELVE
jgi:hypothetical protein